MNDLANRFIDGLYFDGRVYVSYSKEFRRTFEVDENGTLVAEKTRRDSNHIITTYEKEPEIIGFLIELVIDNFTTSENTIKISSDQIDIDEKTKLDVVNKIYSIYDSILSDNRNVIRKMIYEGNGAKVMLDHYLQNYPGFEKIENHCYDIKTIKSLLSKHVMNFDNLLSQGITIKKKYDSVSNDKQLELLNKEWNDFFIVNKISDVKDNISNIDSCSQIDTSLLDKIGISYEIINDRTYIINPAIGREKEIRDVGAILLTPSFSAILLGYPGVGKTAIIEGISYKIQKGEVPDKLLDKKIIKISSSSIVSGCTYVGQFEERMENLINFLKRNSNIILYIDELHTSIGAGASSKNNTDMVNILKPHIENGSIKMIGATTLEEYNNIMKQDLAFTSRFKTIKVDEPDDELLRKIISLSIEKFERITGIIFSSNENIKDEMIDLLIDITKFNYRNQDEIRYNPRLILSIIEEAFGYASYDFKKEVGIKYLSEAINNCENIYNTVRQRKLKQLNLFSTKDLTSMKKPPIKLNV